MKPDPAQHVAPAPSGDEVRDEGPPRYFAWTDRWDPANWETPSNPTRLQKMLAGIALVVVLVMTIYVPLKLLKFV